MLEKTTRVWVCECHGFGIDAKVKNNMKIIYIILYLILVNKKKNYKNYDEKIKINKMNKKINKLYIIHYDDNIYIIYFNFNKWEIKIL